MYFAVEVPIQIEHTTTASFYSDPTHQDIVHLTRAFSYWEVLFLCSVEMLQQRNVSFAFHLSGFFHRNCCVETDRFHLSRAVFLHHWLAVLT